MPSGQLDRDKPTDYKVQATLARDPEGDIYANLHDTCRRGPLPIRPARPYLDGTRTLFAMQSETVERYLEDHAGASRVQLVGPLAPPRTALAEPVIFIDGGTGLRVADEGVAVGDGDSFDGHLDHRLDPDKDFSDLAFALGCLGPRFREIELIGFLGGRRDHEILGFGEVFRFLDRRSTPTRARFDHEVEAFSAGRWRFESRGTFSLVLFAPCRVTLGGDCRYPITPDARVAPMSSLGLSNVGHGRVELEADGPVFIFHDAPPPT